MAASFDWNSARKEWQRISCELWANAPKIHKKFYEIHPDIENMSDEEVESIRESLNNIIVISEGPDPVKNIPKPIVDFYHAFHKQPRILEELRHHGFTKPSPIQCQLWPIALSGYDSVAIAQTGTGKTLGFLLPSFIHAKNQIVDKNERHVRPKVLVLCPTRELALQIESEFNKYTKLLGDYRAICIYGGVSKREQIAELEHGCTFIIATPGRLLDIAGAGKDLLDLSNISFVILDEADRMLDLGFEPQIIRILSQMRPDRQTILTSATWPSDIQRLASKYLMNPVRIHVGTLELNAVNSVEQSFIFIPDMKKFEKVQELIRSLPDEKIIVFCSRKGTCSHLSSELMFAGIPCASIHGDMSQDARIASLQDFRFNECNVLIGTDVASRGIDVPDVTIVINYDMPKTVEDYVHRIGRTGRAGRVGKSISFFTHGDSRVAPELIKILEKAQQAVPDRLMEYRDNPGRPMNDRFKKRFDGGNRYMGNNQNENFGNSQCEEPRLRVYRERSDNFNSNSCYNSSNSGHSHNSYNRESYRQERFTGGSSSYNNRSAQNNSHNYPKPMPSYTPSNDQEEDWC